MLVRQIQPARPSRVAFRVDRGLQQRFLFRGQVDDAARVILVSHHRQSVRRAAAVVIYEGLAKGSRLGIHEAEPVSAFDQQQRAVG